MAFKGIEKEVLEKRLMCINRPTITIDTDGVLLDYHLAYRDAWHKTFGVIPNIREPLGYCPIDRWEVQRLTGSDLENFRESFDPQFWSTVPAIAGALDACLKLHRAEHELVCISGVEQQFQISRLDNLKALGFPMRGSAPKPTEFAKLGNTSS